MRKDRRAICGECQSFWDLDSLQQSFTYDEQYPERRHHFNDTVGMQKVRTLRHWLKRVAVDLRNLVVCEVGFGGAHCLVHLTNESKIAFGIEAMDANITHAQELGLSGGNLFLAQALPDKLPRPVDLWIFQDSFEHIPDPGPFVTWMLASSAARAGIFLVAPCANSVSQILMGDLWPHRLPDHQFHWSQKGLKQFLSKRQFFPVVEFFPLKFISFRTVLDHIAHKLGRSPSQSRIAERLVFPFNFGEMGFLFERKE